MAFDSCIEDDLSVKCQLARPMIDSLEFRLIRLSAGYWRLAPTTISLTPNKDKQGLT